MKYILTALLFAGLAWSTQAYAQSRIELVPYAAELGTAVDITHAGDGRLFVARQYGAIFLVRDSMDVADIEFLDIASRVLFNGERGLLGMAFDPDFATNGHFYVNYITGTGDGISRISRFTVGPNPDVADPNSEVVLISLPQPNPIHQAGGLAFGTDGYLYCALGDGGGSDDPNNEGQDPTSLFGTILRIKPEADGTYSIPPDNPFVGASGDTLPEIWAYGLRNPFRFGIDPANGDLWIGDVGQERWEELDHWPGGLNTGPNFGWRCYEGNAPFITAGCADSTTFQWPVVALSHGILGGTACAIVAGEVYRGTRYPYLYGRHLYTDFCSGELRSVMPDGQGGWVDELLLSTGMLGITSIGADSAGELYTTNVISGLVHKIVDRCAEVSVAIDLVGDSLVSTEADTYQWFLNGDTITGATDRYLELTGNGTYTVSVTLNEGCAVDSEPYVFLSTAMFSPASPGAVLRIRPVPADDVVYIEGDGTNSAGAMLHILDARGRMLRAVRWPVGGQRMAVPVRDLVDGLYTALLIGDAGSRSARFLVQH